VVITSDKDICLQLLSDNSSLAEKGWRYIYRTYYPMVHTFILGNSGTEDDAIDIFQDTLLIFSRNLKNGAFREESSIKTYLFGICKNLWFKEIQRKKRAQIFPLDQQDNDGHDLEYLKNIEKIGHLINQLQEGCKQILIEFYYNNRSMAELKDLFQLNSIQAAKNKKWRCLSYLVRMFKENRNMNHIPDE
jgi:RNA polymerase sigma factor (sigma-70 family)